MRRKNRWILLFVAGSMMLIASHLSAAEAIYGHVSFVDNGAMVAHADGSENQAVVNMPVVPGDTMVTSDAGRCELQFDNGTVIRLDKNSRLRITTVQAPTLTSHWKITTLHLLQGQLYSLPQTYNREVFQIITPSAAVKLKSRTAATIRLDADLGTSLFSDRGKFAVLYGTDSRALKTLKVKSGQAMAISAANVALDRVAKRSLEFVAWNEYVDRHFKELHYGISKVPPKLKFGNNALVYWAEKWSSLVGEWIYDEIFGYVWKPADEQFAYSARPFFNAEFVRINGQLFLVPQEAWGWVPAHMGTWVWLSRGWTWIPGNWFHTGVVSCPGGWTFPTLGYYWGMYSYWNIHWNQPRQVVEPEWPYEPEMLSQKPGMPILPEPVIRLIKKVEKVVASDANKRQAVERIVPGMDGVKIPLAPVPRKVLPTPVPAAPPSADRGHGRTTPLAVEMSGGRNPARDWNPDNRWAARNGYTILYSSSSNSVVCPELKISSDRFGNAERLLLRDSASRQSDRGASGATAVSQPATSANDPGTVTGTTDPDPGAGDKEKKDDGGRAR